MSLMISCRVHRALQIQIQPWHGDNMKNSGPFHVLKGVRDRQHCVSKYEKRTGFTTRKTNNDNRKQLGTSWRKLRNNGQLKGWIHLFYIFYSSFSMYQYTINVLLSQKIKRFLCILGHGLTPASWLYTEWLRRYICPPII